MSCTIKLTEEQKAWFNQRSVAWAIVNEGVDDITEKNFPHGNLVALLRNMCDYGRKNWKYEPGNTTHVDNTLKDLHDVTDCGSVAEMFRDMAHNLGYADAKTRHLTPEGNRDRIVTAADLACFTGQVGDPSIEGRWCFGDHWIVVCLSKCYDPTFNEYFDDVPLPPYFGWWGKYVSDREVFTASYYENKENKNIYIGHIVGQPGRPARPAISARSGFCGIGRRAAQPAQPEVAPIPGKMFYTFKKTDRAGKEIE